MEGHVSIDFPSGGRLQGPTKSRSAAAARARRLSRRGRPYASWRLYFHRRVRRVLGRKPGSWGSLVEKPPCLGTCTITLHRLRRFVRPYVPQIARIFLVISLLLDAGSMLQRSNLYFDHTNKGGDLGLDVSFTRRGTSVLDWACCMIGIVSGFGFAACHFETQSFYCIITYMLYRDIRSMASSTFPCTSCVRSLACICSVCLMKQIKKRRRIQLSELDGTFVYAPKQCTAFGFTEADIANLATRIFGSVLLLNEVCVPVMGRRLLYFALVVPFVIGLAVGLRARMSAFVCILLLASTFSAQRSFAPHDLGPKHSLCVIAALTLIVHSGPNALSVDNRRRPSIDRQTDWHDSYLKFEY